jgi:aminopeptidase N
MNMGWWKTGKDDDIIGDAPADTIAEVFAAIASSFEEEGKPKPTLQQVLDAIILVLREKGADIFESTEEISNQTLVAELEPTSAKVWSRGNNITDENLVKAFEEAFEEIVNQYQDSVNRKPRLPEILASIKFILGYNPDEYLLIEENISVKKLWFE